MKAHPLKGTHANDVPVIAAELEAAAEERGLRKAMAAMCEGCAAPEKFGDTQVAPTGKVWHVIVGASAITDEHHIFRLRCRAEPIRRALLEGKGK